MNKAQLADVSAKYTQHVTLANFDFNAMQPILIWMFLIPDDYEALQDDTDQRERDSHIFHLHGEIGIEQAGSKERTRQRWTLKFGDYRIALAKHLLKCNRWMHHRGQYSSRIFSYNLIHPFISL